MLSIFRMNDSQHLIQAATAAGLGILCTAVPIASIAATANDNNRIQQQPNTAQPIWKRTIEQQQAWQDAIQQQRIEALRQAQPEDKRAVTTVPDDKTSDDKEPGATPSVDEDKTQTFNCLPTQRIELGNMPELSHSVQTQLRQLAQRLSTPMQSIATPLNRAQCLSVADANELVRHITQAYLDVGYFKITIEPTDSQQGISLWHVSVAKIIDIDNHTKLPTSRLFGNVLGKAANMALLDQAVSNGERVIDGQLLIDIYPVGKDVRLKVSQQGQIDTLGADLEWRYDPDDSYGHNQLRLHGTLRNIFGQADVTSMSIQQSLTEHYGYDEDNQRRSVSIYTSIPNGRWQWSGLLAADEYQRTIKLPNSLLEQTGDSWQANIRGDYTFHRNQHSISSVYGQLAHQDVTSELLGSRLAVQSPTLSSARLGVNHTKLFNNRNLDNPLKVTTGAWVVDFSVEQGFGNHDNPATGQGLKDDYLRWLLSGYVSHQHSMVSSGQLIGYWQMTHELEGQYSDDLLFGITQQSLGSTYSGVRGISNAYNAAESGVTLRNTLSFEPMQSAWQAFGTQQIRWSPYVGADYGVVKYSGRDLEDDTSDAMSATAGLKLIGYDVIDKALERKWELDVSASRARVDYANQQIKKRQDTEVSAAWRWFF
ncbi:ShlB/FhaC/HecB family hemolysin secretion/activation protein [Psychrobacter lutiphocae]|uniref:ShlB/FhaC/HecB family hemolysin secretion/activation protein n=1 Tax=Psychrobacter lutiphocae TaxID=540500 RepID=UPI0009FC57F4|nr:ShlB/FhaC/HecB family hemolysin secretion/activation protein [Psychrobacter lutiphocae]